MFKKKISAYCVEYYAGASWWQLQLLPSIEVSYDNEGVYVKFKFLAYYVIVSVYNIKKQQQWEDKFL